MKVDPNLQSVGNLQSDTVQNAKTARTQSSASSASGTSQVDGLDTVQVSGSFALVQSLTSQLQQVPDIRSDRVAQLRQQIQQGTYNPSSSDIAGAILNDPLSRLGNA